jgi:lysozyme
MARDRTPPRRRGRLPAASAAALALGGGALAEVPASAPSRPKGHDVSSHQRNVDWPGARTRGARFVYVKATAAHFVRDGGSWTADGWTLPPALDIEYNPYDKKHKRYGLTRAGMAAWIKAFSDETERLAGRRPVIHTTTHGWNTCTGGSRAPAAGHALWIARHDAPNPGALPAGWSSWTFWQYDNGGGVLPGDQNLFNGSLDQLKRFARGA